MSGRRSTSATRAPRCAYSRAAVQPATLAPTTTTSKSRALIFGGERRPGRRDTGAPPCPSPRGCPAPARTRAGPPGSGRRTHRGPAAPVRWSTWNDATSREAARASEELASRCAGGGGGGRPAPGRWGGGAAARPRGAGGQLSAEVHVLAARGDAVDPVGGHRVVARAAADAVAAAV